MNHWLEQFSILIIAWVVVELIFFALLVPLLKPIARLYDAPHGKWVLLATWFVAVGAMAVAPQLGPDYVGVSMALVTLSIPFALIATIVFRDRQRAAAGLPDLNVLPPGTKYTWLHALYGYRKSEASHDAPAR